MSDFPDHPFWDFSLSVYMTPGVGPACVALQEAHELDVNIVLFCLWAGASGRGALDAADMAAAAGAVAVWHAEVVRPLRAVRTRMKGGMPPAPGPLAESLRQRIQKVEIDCEHTEQLMLAGALDRPADESRSPAARARDAAANIARYCAHIGCAPTDSDRRQFAAILGVAFPALSAAEVDAASAVIKEP